MKEIAQRILAVERPHPVRVAIDGCSAAGKTTFADGLVGWLSARPVVRVGIDHFKRAVALRTAYPADSPESYYLDSWDNAAIVRWLLAPLGPGGDRHYRSAVMDLPALNAVDGPVLVAPDDAILIADGCFLQRPELNPYWDLRVWLDVDFEDVLRRGVERDKSWMGGSADAARARYLSKYIPGERRYIEDVNPRRNAQVVVDNRDPANPRIV